MGSQRRVFAIACLLLAGLWAIEPDTPRISPSEIGLHEGQSVAVAGVVVAIEAWGDGHRMVVAADGAATRVAWDDPAPIGSWVIASGTVQRSFGDLVLEAESVAAAPPPGPAQLPLSVVAAGGWTDQWILLHGVGRGDTLAADGHVVALSESVHGRVAVTGVLRNNAACLCQQLVVSEVRPWTP